MNKIFLIITLITISYSQGKMNAYGLGHFYGNQGVRNAMDGIVSLTPSFSENINFSNPSTWHNFRYTFLSLSYSGAQNSLNNNQNINGYSGLSDALWIVPFKSKYAMGFSLTPYLNQKVSLIGRDSLTYLAFEDTLNVKSIFMRSGGVMSMNIGASYKINEFISFGLMAEILFGSSRQSESINFGGSSITKTIRNRYNGLTSNSFLSIILPGKTRLFTSLRFTVKPLESAYLEKNLFDDVNQNGYHDWTSPYFDFPFPDSVKIFSENRIDNIHNPASYQIGIDRRIAKKISLAVEYFNETEKSENKSSLYVPIKNQVHKIQKLKFSFIKYPNQISLKTFDKFSFRTGILHSNYYLQNSEIQITELGFSLGIGYKFKTFGNQLDCNYYFGHRKYPKMPEKELVQQVQVGISLADIWFVKRRQK